MSFYAFKGFDKDLKCRGFQYEVGKTYSMPEKPEVCVKGFHCCLKISDVFTFYSPIKYDFSVTDSNIIEKNISTGNRYCIVEVLGAVDDNSFGEMRYSTKIVTNEIKIVRELTIDEIIVALEDELISTRSRYQMMEGTLSDLMNLNHIDKNKEDK